MSSRTWPSRAGPFLRALLLALSFLAAGVGLVFVFDPGTSAAGRAGAAAGAGLAWLLAARAWTWRPKRPAKALARAPSRPDVRTRANLLLGGGGAILLLAGGWGLLVAATERLALPALAAATLGDAALVTLAVLHARTLRWGASGRRRAGRSRLAHAARALAWAGLLAILFVDWLPTHEYLHCALAWTRGASGACQVTYFRTPEAGLGNWGLAQTGAIPWWEHPLIYGAEFATLVPVAIHLARDLAGFLLSFRRESPQPEPSSPRS